MSNSSYETKVTVPGEVNLALFSFWRGYSVKEMPVAGYMKIVRRGRPRPQRIHSSSESRIWAFRYQSEVFRIYSPLLKGVPIGSRCHGP